MVCTFNCMYMSEAETFLIFAHEVDVCEIAPKEIPLVVHGLQSTLFVRLNLNLMHKIVKSD